MNADNFHHGYETRGSFRSLLSRMEVNEAAASQILPDPHPDSSRAHDCGNRKDPSSTEVSSNKDSDASWVPRTIMSTPSASMRITALTPPSTPSEIEPAHAQPAHGNSHFENFPSRTKSKPVPEPRSTTADTPSTKSPPDAPKQTKQDATARGSGKRRRNDEPSAVPDEILGPFAQGLSRSKRDMLRAAANALRDESGSVCPLAMAQLYAGSSTLGQFGQNRSIELENGERAIRKMRNETFDLRRLRDRQEREEAERREKEERRMANKRKYGLLRNRGPSSKKGGRKQPETKEPGTS